MVKTPAQWITRKGDDTVATISTSLLTLESAVTDFLLCEDGSFLQLEDNVVTIKEASQWSQGDG